MTAVALTGALVLLEQAEPARDLGRDTLQRCRRVLGREHAITQFLSQLSGAAADRS